MKLTKSQLALLDDAAINRRGCVLVVRMYQTGGAAKAEGYRAQDAANKLVDAGLLVFVGSDRSQEHKPRRIMVRHYVETTYSITDAGRAALSSAFA